MPKTVKKPNSRRSIADLFANPSEIFLPIYLFTIIITGIVLAEVVAMVVVYFLPPKNYVLLTLVDAGVMVLLIFPVLYYFSFRPLLQLLEKRKQFEQELLQKDELQQRFFNSIDTLIAYMDAEFNFMHVNDAYARAAGYAPDFFLDKNHFELYPHVENEQIFRRVVETGEPFVVYEKPFEYPDQPELGVTYWNWNLQPVHNLDGSVAGVVLSLVDVTQRKLAEEKVELERARLKSILDNMPDGVYIINHEYEIEYTNPVIERDFGPINNQKCYQYFHGKSEPCEICKNEEVFHGRSFRWEWDSMRAGKLFEVFDTPLKNTDGSVSKLKLIHDITHRKLVETELEKRNLALEVMSASESKQRQVSETLRAVTNELSQSLDMDTVLKALLKHVRELISADTGHIFLLDENAHSGEQATERTKRDTISNIQFASRQEIDAKPLFRKMVLAPETRLIPDITQEADWVAYPGAEDIRSYLMLPLQVEDNLIGLIGLGNHEAGYFTEEHIQWAKAIVGQAEVAIHNAWLYGQVRAGRERMQLLSRRLVEIQEAEQRFVARELHDQASQTLISLTLGLEALEKEADNPHAVREKTVELKRVSDIVLADLHRIAVRLRPASLDIVGLVPSIQQILRLITQDSNLKVNFKSVGIADDFHLPMEVEINLCRIVQESVNNVIRHANASQVDVVLERLNHELVLVIEDDGKGFETAYQRSGDHLGLLGMQERAEMLGGTLSIESAPGSGTTLIVKVPGDPMEIAGG